MINYLKKKDSNPMYNINKGKILITNVTKRDSLDTEDYKADARNWRRHKMERHPVLMQWDS